MVTVHPPPHHLADFFLSLEAFFSFSFTANLASCLAQHATEPRHRSCFSRQRAPRETKPPSSSRPRPSLARRPLTGGAGAAAGGGVRGGWEPTGCGERGGGMTRRRIPSLYPLPSCPLPQLPPLLTPSSGSFTSSPTPIFCSFLEIRRQNLFTGW